MRPYRCYAWSMAMHTEPDLLTRRTSPDAPVASTGFAERYWPAGLWLWPGLAGTTLAALWIGRPQLDTDELVTWDVARRSFGQIMATSQNVDAVHTTYYLLMHAWITVFGDSAAALRAPSALAAGATAAFVALIGKRLFSTRAGLSAGFLFALIPSVSRYGQEARSYALVTCAATCGTLLLLRALDKPGAPARWAAYTGCLVMTGLLHLLALFVLGGHAVTVIAARRRGDRPALWAFMLATAVAVACLIPLALSGSAQQERQLFWIPRPGIFGLSTLWPSLFTSGVCAGGVIALALLAQRGVPLARATCWTLILLPALSLWAVSFVTTVSYFRLQYLLFTLPAAAVLAGAGLARFTSSTRATAACLAALTLLLVPDQIALRAQFAHQEPQDTDYAAAARTIIKYYAPGDAVVYVRGLPWMLDQGVQYYLPRSMHMREIFRTATAAENHELYPLYCPVPARCIGPERRVWLVVAGNAPDPLESVPANWAQALRAVYTDSGTERPNGITVALLRRKS